ncbi:MAG: site-specific integrase [Alphaproteobacteria bacterium]|nr:site-specific integrase [Alphaproteobacteria bacterium]
MAYIQKRSSKDGTVSYRVQIRRKGYPLQTASFSRKTDADRWARSTEAAIEEGRYRNVAQAKRRTVAELIDRYAEDYLPQKSKLGKDQRHQLRWWREQVGTMTLADLTPELIADCRNKLSKTTSRRNRPLSAGSVNRYLAALSHALTIGVKELRWLPASPMRDVSKLKEPRGRDRHLSDHERDRLLAACRESDSPYLHTIVVLAISTGMRRGEILGLKWEAVDLPGGRITLRETKNDELRVVTLTGKAHALMSALAEIRNNSSPYVFAGDNPVKPIDIKRSWYTALRRAKLEEFRFHDLRHTAASYLAMNGATLPEIADVLGHKTYDMVKRYAHLSEEHTAGVVERMNEKIFGDE